jgi:hypothetical protein
MCGRARLSSDVSEIRIAFGIPPERPTPNFGLSWNVAPTDPLPVVRYDAKDRQRSLEVMRWGLVPFWAKDIKVGFANINAKAEGIENKPAFREALPSTPNSSKYRKANKENRHVSFRVVFPKKRVTSDGTVPSSQSSIRRQLRGQRIPYSSRRPAKFP